MEEGRRGAVSKHTASVCHRIYNNLKLHEKMAIKSHRQTKLRDQCVLLRFYCENAKKSSALRGRGEPHARGERIHRETVQSNRKYDCVWEALYYLSFGWNRHSSTAAQRGGAGAVALLVLPGAAAAGTWASRMRELQLKLLLLLLTCQVNVIFMADCQLKRGKPRQARAKPTRTLRTPQPPEDRFIILPNLKLCHTSVI